MRFRFLLALMVSAVIISGCSRAGGTGAAAGPAKAPTVCPTPKAADANQLQVDFTGVLIFKRGLPPDPPFRVIIPFLTDHSAYIQYREADLAAPPDGFNAPGDLEKCCGRDYVLLVNHQLDIQGDDAHGPLQEGDIDQFLVHLKDITGIDKLNPHYDSPLPAPGYVAAQMDLRRGSLTPLLPEDKKTFLLKDGNDVYKAGGACLAQGVRLRLDLRPRSIVKILGSSGATLSLAAHDDRPTLMRIGNSLKQDILCPEPTSDKDDLHFANLYKMLARKPPKAWIPRKTDDDCFAVPAPPSRAGLRPGERTDITVGVFSYHGSNCLPGQLP
jgi:hypothetical protein